MLVKYDEIEPLEQFESPRRTLTDKQVIETRVVIVGFRLSCFLLMDKSLSLGPKIVFMMSKLE